MNKEEKKNIDAVLGMNKTLIDSIYNACKTNSDEFDVDYVPVTYLNMMCDLAQDRIKAGIGLSATSALSSKDKKNTKKVLEMTYKLLIAIKTACRVNAKTYHVDYVPITFLKSICDTLYAKLKTNFKKGFGN